MPLFAIGTGKHLSRRAFLRGAGAAVGLPLLDAMTPAFARAASGEAPRRFVAVCATLGFHTPFLVPKGVGMAYAPTPYLDALKEHRDQLTVFSGLSHAEQNGANGHSSELTWLTAARRPELAGFKNTVSLDQVIAQKVGLETRFPYLALTTSNASLSWAANGVPIPGVASAEKVYSQLFFNGTPAEVQAQMRALRRGRSILDTVSAEAKKLDRTLGAHDRLKLDEYFDAVRGLETRLQQSEGWATRPKPKVDAQPPTDIRSSADVVGRVRLMYEMIALAFRTDSTRTVTLRLAGTGSVPPIEGVKSDWHNLSHHGQDAAKIEELKLIEMAEFEALAEFLGRLKAAEAGGTLLDRTTVLFGSNLGNASAHDWRNLPVLVAGGGYKHAGHLAFDSKNNPALSNLYVALAQRMGVEADKFGGSTAAGVKGFDLKG